MARVGDKLPKWRPPWVWAEYGRRGGLAKLAKYGKEAAEAPLRAVRPRVSTGRRPFTAMQVKFPVEVYPLLDRAAAALGISRTQVILEAFSEWWVTYESRVAKAEAKRKKESG